MYISKISIKDCTSVIKILDYVSKKFQGNVSINTYGKFIYIKVAITTKGQHYWYSIPINMLEFPDNLEMFFNYHYTEYYNTIHNTVKEDKNG